MKKLSTKKFNELKIVNKIDMNNKIYFLDCINNQFEEFNHPEIYRVDVLRNYNIPYNKNTNEIILVTNSKNFLQEMKKLINLNS